MARTAVGLLLGLAFIAAVIWSAFEATQVQCEICVEYGGRSACSTAQAADVLQAEAQALSGACSQVTGGVTQTLECDRTPPVTRRCTE
jgi:hypothetical protein